MQEPVPDIYARTLAMLDTAIDSGIEFLAGSKFDPLTKKLIGQGIERIAAILKKKVLEMPEADIKKQLYFIRDQVLPFLLGEDESNTNQ